MKTRILVMGAGAIGSVFGGLLKKAGHEVALVGRKAHMDAVAKKGLHITGLLGNHQVKNQQKSGTYPRFKSLQAAIQALFRAP